MSGKKKKAFIAPKYAEQASLYDRLKKIRDISLTFDQVQHHVGPGASIVDTGTSTPGRKTGTGPERAVSGAADLEQLAEDIWSQEDPRANFSGTGSAAPAGDGFRSGIYLSGGVFQEGESGFHNSEMASARGYPITDQYDNLFLSSDEEEEEDVDYSSAPDISVDGEYIQAIPSNSGVYHTVVPMKNLSFNMAEDESVIQQGGSFIVLGTDRRTGVTTGYGAKGYQNASTIDLVVGRLAASRGTKGPADGSLADNNPAADAARVYISQLTDIDVMFGLDWGVSGVATGGSGIALKADDIRIIGQRSVKIITGNAQGVRGGGRKGEWTSLGFNMHQPAPTIELLAGNRKQDRVVWGGIYNPIETISTVQRACLGGNTRDALAELNDTIGEIWSALFNLALIQAGYNANLGVDPFRPWVAAAAPVVGIANLDAVLNSLWHTKMNSICWEMNHLTPYGYKFICSTNIKLS